MPNLEASFRALRVLHTAKDLFNQYGFHKVGIDRIIAESKGKRPLNPTFSNSLIPR